MRVLVLAIRIMCVLTLGGCPPGQGCQPECEVGLTGAQVGWVTGPALRGAGTVAPEGATTEWGEDALVEDFSCYALDRWVTYRGRFDPNTWTQIVGEVLNFAERPADLSGNKVRIVLDCDGVTPALVKVRWYGPDGRAIGDVPISLPSKPDSGLIDGRGSLCIYNPTNVNVKVTAELYLPEYECVGPNAHIEPWNNVRGGVTADPTCAASPPPFHPCADPDEWPGYHGFCQICDGSYTTRTTVEFYGYCHDEALAIAQNNAANCEITEGECE
jgi:hypothetical protein